ncbi:transposase [Arthrobacter sp. zg-Y844]|uniref:transposase n=1 Tax=Arthrobacter sp. zg-Y844 TaxID=2964612 RepID=UPI002102C316|nr:transposase [Arthrobacter sp. zg-Y844]MCQ1987392.1 transposase [Arthrobacter sp. zg-Y844]
MSSADPHSPPPLGAAVVELYALLPAEFTAARNARAADAGRAGDKELAKRIKALPKPSTAAWLVNLLAHQRREDLDQVLELGAALREAQEDLDQKQLRRLSTERQRLLRAIVRQARDLASELDHPVSESLAAEAEQTLWAAMTDPSAADAVASGQLVRSLAASGWEEVDLDGAVADPDSISHGAGGRAGSGSAADGAGTAKDKGGSSDSAAVRRRQAEARRAVRKAETDLEEAAGAERRAQEALDTAQREVDESAGRRDGLTDEIDELRERIRQLEREVATVDRRSGKLERERDNARRTARAARRTAEKARQKLADAQDLSDGGTP